MGTADGHGPLQILQPAAGIPGLYEMRFDTQPGMHVVHLHAENVASSATVTYCLPNRATLFTAVLGADAGMAIHQFLLPLAKLRSNLTQTEQDAQPDNLLEAIRFTTLAQRQLARKRDPKPPDQGLLDDDEKLAADRQRWQSLLYGKWLDPVMALMAAYELVRTTPVPYVRDAFVKEAMGNLRRYFGAIPDVELIAKLAGESYTEPTAAPMFLAGVQALDNTEKVLPFSLFRLDYTGPWVTGLGVN